MFKWLSNPYLEPLIFDFTREGEVQTSRCLLFVARSCGWLVVSVAVVDRDFHGPGLSRTLSCVSCSFNLFIWI